jgi:hypothetical protein
MNIKRIMGFVLALIITLTYTMTAIAGVTDLSIDELTQNDIDKSFDTIVVDSVQYIINVPEDFGFTISQINDAYFGQPFRFAHLNEDCSTYYNKNIIYFPVYSGENLIAIMSLIKYQGEVFCSIGKDFSDKLMKILSSSANNRVALIAIGNNLYAIDEDSNTYSLLNINYFTQLDNTAISETELMLKYEDVISTQNIISEESKSVVKTFKDLQTSGMVVPQRSEVNLPDYPIVDQKVNGVQMGICWAATIASMARYEFPDTYGSLTAKQVCDAEGHDYCGATWTTIMSCFSRYFTSPYIPTKIDDALTNAQVQTVINNNDPAYMSSLEVGGEGCHATALCGYNSGLFSFTIRIMDPAYECFKTGTYSIFTGYTYAFGDATYRWDKTVRLLYEAE